MINIDFECINKHKFEGCFNDYNAYKERLNSGYITCPLCETKDIKRIFSGCSIHARSSPGSKTEKTKPEFFDKIKEFNKFVKENFEDTGDNFADRARAIHYGIDEEKNIYGTATTVEMKELIDEGISVFPVLDDDKLSN